jgi:hypothetical protein
VAECEHCYQEVVGRASYNGMRLCLPPEGADRPNCYHLVAQEHHHIPCDHQECVDAVRQLPDL